MTLTLPEALRKAVPPLESCLPLYVQTKRATERELSGAPAKPKNKLLLHSLDLFHYQLATKAYASFYLEGDAPAQAAYARLASRLCAYYDRLPASVITAFDQAVREAYYLRSIESFDAATESSELWIQMMSPALLRNAVSRAQEPGPWGELPNAWSPNHAEGICPEFARGHCGYIARQQELYGVNGVREAHCPNGRHYCAQHGTTDESRANCYLCNSRAQREARPRNPPRKRFRPQPQGQQLFRQRDDAQAAYRDARPSPTPQRKDAAARGGAERGGRGGRGGWGGRGGGRGGSQQNS